MKMSNYERTRAVWSPLSREVDSGRVTGLAGSWGTGGQLLGRSVEISAGSHGRQAVKVVNPRNPVEPKPRAEVPQRQTQHTSSVKVSTEKVSTEKVSTSHVQLRKPLGIATWNVRTLCSDGKLEILEREMCRLNISCLGISETRWTGVGHFRSDSGSTVIFSGGTTRRQNGVGVIVQKEMAKALLGYNPISDRLLTVRFAARPWNLTLIQAYAPTNQATDTEKEDFYALLQQVYQQVPKQDIVLLAGDMNAKIGNGAPIGEHALGVRNDNGGRLIEFAQANGLLAANAMVRRHPRRLYTWQSFDGAHRNQIDYFLVPKRWITSVRKCRSYPSADADTDHTLVGLKFSLKLRKLSKPKVVTKYDLSNSEQFRLELRDRLTSIAAPAAEGPTQVSKCQQSGCQMPGEEVVQTANSMWVNLRDAILESAEKTLVPTRETQKQPWVKTETLALIEEKRKHARGSDQYRALKREVRSRIKRDKREHFESICEEVERCDRTNRPKDLFTFVNRLTKRACPQVKLVQSESGAMLTEDSEIMSRWKRYCENLYSTTERAPDGLGRNGNRPITPCGASGTSEGATDELRMGANTEPTPSIEEVERALGSMRPGKAVGPDNLSVELLKLGGGTVTRAIHRIIELVWNTGQWPEDWTMSTFVPLFKKGDPTVCANYRTISLISHASKVMLKVILERIRAKAEFEMSEEQAGFRPGKGTQTHLCNLRLITERARAHRQPLYLCFIDFEKAFDTISHKKLWRTMESMGFSRHTVSLIRSLYETQKSNVRLANSRSDWFAVLRGVRQGCNLSPYLFNIMAEVLMRMALDGFEGGFRIGGRTVTNLRYADDIVLIASSEAELQDLVRRVHLAAREMDMKVNVSKTKVMKVCDDETPISVTIEGEVVEEVDSFKYLGAMFNSSALCAEEIRTRLANARERMGQLMPLWRSQTISNPLKARLIQALVWPIATYGCEAWTLNKELTGNIEAFEMQCYRRAMRIPYVLHVTNVDVLQDMGQDRMLLNRVKSHKLKYFGHVTRHPGLEKDLMLGMMPGTRRQGGQRRQWVDDVIQWSDHTLPTMVRLAENRLRYRQFVHSVTYASPGVWYT